MIVRGVRTAAVMPPTEAAVLLVALHLAVRAYDFVALVYRSFEVGRRDPVVVEVDAHAVIKVHTHLHGVVSVDAVAHEALLLADGRERHWFALEVMIDQIHPV